jgi:hypothetical protein
MPLRSFGYASDWERRYQENENRIVGLMLGTLALLVLLLVALAFWCPTTGYQSYESGTQPQEVPISQKLVPAPASSERIHLNVRIFHFRFSLGIYDESHATDR